jgi:hypothetical protein
MPSRRAVGPTANGTHQLPAYTDDVNLLGKNREAIKRNTETLTDDSEWV